MGANAPTQHHQLFHPQPQQQRLLSVHQPSLGSSSQLLQQDSGGSSNGGKSIDQDYALQNQRHPSARPSAVARPQLFSDFFRRYELMIEFTNLRNPHHCPSGLYVMPAADNMNLWFGTLFIHKGYYRNAVFKFQLVIPADYPDRRPTVRFLSDMWHPLIDNQGQLALQYQFPQWRPHRDYLFHVLHFVKAAFKKCVLDTIVEKQANKIFAKLAQQRAQLSITESSLYDNYPSNNSIKFSPLSDEEFGECLPIFK
ncbi:ubiquitin-conjugating enzyme/RWD-like protein [Gamsiella multidivaricata]|uniref:ubiquitin-conjugating enzyme/RWD-like protein n=1 Tax=Gamsiella multidivaricata TaxID=101098 RepID=UPI0022201E8D|nr:ubiquitin-conjugating enzyme/RWD-like protein [Gamsiella multidivaricata]KAI7818632.1 ubiquitin-conjugating enzyme/RWD-like protein [Gamsiella multidivaricata]